MPNRIIVPPPVRISARESKIFINSIMDALSCLSRSDLFDLYLFKEDDLVLSFDAEYQPFIGRTHGYNRIEQRVPVQQFNNIVFASIADGLEAIGRDISGGRVFINKDCAYINNDGLIRTFLTFRWRGKDPIYQIKLNVMNIKFKKLEIDVLKMTKRYEMFA